ncbi:hypothetical protein EAX61_03275 [Dokdonia sinensis]|uniref:Uncharacterized protein n=1 Tax=Dokdonia sinensis TaxID=2479847 RepID=A0A3M0GET2_9FLAO|nr:hypothetical protein [Dokdonia sinensis]RMB63425.1 hypothetical protein EAX61_03275 [Dokdonia sinensis]
MKKALIVLIILAIVLGVFNATQINLDQSFKGDNAVAAIGVIGCACVVVLLLILRSSKKIAERAKGNS